jgi:hypothetical protein
LTDVVIMLPLATNTSAPLARYSRHIQKISGVQAYTVQISTRRLAATMKVAALPLSALTSML